MLLAPTTRHREQSCRPSTEPEDRKQIERPHFYEELLKGAPMGTDQYVSVKGEGSDLGTDVYFALDSDSENYVLEADDEVTHLAAPAMLNAARFQATTPKHKKIGYILAGCLLVGLLFVILFATGIFGSSGSNHASQSANTNQTQVTTAMASRTNQLVPDRRCSVDPDLPPTREQRLRECCAGKHCAQRVDGTPACLRHSLQKR